METFLARAGRWFIESGIQEPEGGVARHRRIDLGRNAPVSTEITGYAVSTLLYLHAKTGDEAYRNAGLSAAQFLVDKAWDRHASTYPFEPGSTFAYFFDTGIVVRGLLAAYRATGNEEFRSRAVEAGLSLAFDFLGEGVYHPIIELPEKQPVPYEKRWAREPGCFQLKSALAWRDLGDPHATQLFERFLEWSLAHNERFLPGVDDREKVMDRLHAYSYFLEGLLAVSDRADARAALAAGLAKASALHREIAPTFERSDVAAQLLRVRLAAHHLGALELDEKAASHEAQRVESFLSDRDGFLFGRKKGEPMPFANPVSTGFCLQALQMWSEHQRGAWTFQLHELI